MTKAFALAAREHPELRRAYFAFPWAHLGQYEGQVASVVISRRVGDEDVIFLAPLPSPEEQPLPDLDAQLRHYAEAPVESVGNFRDALRVARLPALLRRPLWWLALNASPRRRVRHFGTFGVTTMSPFGAKTLSVPSLWTSFLHYGVITEGGEVPVGVAFDHRVVDGAVVGYALQEMEQALHNEIAAELRALPAVRAA
jgi:hypothetical protein